MCPSPGAFIYPEAKPVHRSPSHSSLRPFSSPTPSLYLDSSITLLLLSLHWRIPLLCLSCRRIHVSLLRRYMPRLRRRSLRHCQRSRTPSSILHFLAIHTWRGSRVVDALSYLIAPLEVYVFEVESVYLMLAYEVSRCLTCKSCTGVDSRGRGGSREL